jgi:RNA polymerase sigma-70 factor (ECF subfamily)
MNSDLLSSVFGPISEQSDAAQLDATQRVCGEHALRIEALFREEHPRVVAYLVARTGSWAEARDVAAQAFTQLLVMKDPGAVNSFRAYLYTVALNIAKDRKKLAAIRGRIVGIARHEFTSTSPSPEPLLFAEERLRVLQEVVEGLRPLWREVLTLKYWEHLEVNEMVVRFAQRGVDVNKRTVERWLHDAVAACRRKVRAAEGDGGGK